MPDRWGRESGRNVPPDWKRRKAAALTAHGHICHVCRHGKAEECDHILNVARGGSHEPDNLAPIHGQPCPTCGVRCHMRKTQAEAAQARAARRAKGKHPTERHPGLS